MKFLSLFFFSLLFFSCTQQSIDNKQIVKIEGVAFGISYELQLSSSVNEPIFEKAKEAIEKTFAEVDRHFNKWNPDSELSKLNRAEAGPSAISSELYAFLQRVESLVKLTEGRFDPTVETLQRVWRPALEEGRCPSKEELASSEHAAGWASIQLKEGFCHKRYSQTALDLGGVAKGFAVDLIVERVSELGLNGVYFEWGGEVACRGRHPSGRPWRIFISRLGDSDPSHAIDILNLADEGVATSGDYLQKWHTAEGELCHIFSLYDKRPLKIEQSSIASATVLASSCCDADALATAMMTFASAQEAEDWVKKLQSQRGDLAVWLVTRD